MVRVWSEIGWLGPMNQYLKSDQVWFWSMSKSENVDLFKEVGVLVDASTSYPAPQ